jgi:transposase
MNEGVYMTRAELSRAEIFLLVSQKRITQAKAAEELNLSVRQIERLYSSFKKQGIKALASKRRGRPSNHKLTSDIRRRLLELVTCEIYSGFGPTLMCEKLEQLHGIKVSRETVRQIMIESMVWETKRQKSPIIHQQRKRRARFGELLQIDGSPHAWFEDRADPCDLIIYIDDATGHVYGQFFEAETTEAYMKVMHQYIEKYGRPLACYSDKHGIFRINKPGTIHREHLTQFGRALQELDIELIYANSPQAKGRVERAFQTLQDRLIKEMRLSGISSIEDGNEFLQSYWEKYNRQFAGESEDTTDAHRQLLLEHNLDRILCYKEHRKISKNMEIQYKNKVYQLILDKPLKTLRGAKITVLESFNGEIVLEYNGRELPCRTYNIQNYNEEKTSKEINQFLRDKQRYKPPYHHPWNQEGRVSQKMHVYR